MTKDHGMIGSLEFIRSLGFGYWIFLSPSRMLKNAYLLRFPHPSSLRRTSKYASGRLTTSSAWHESLLIRRDAALRISGALHLGIFEHPAKIDFFSKLLVDFSRPGRFGNRHAVLFELEFIEAAVLPVEANQFLVASCFDDSAFREDNDSMGISNG